MVDYDPETGSITWRVRAAACVRVGQIAGWVTAGGYRKVPIKGKYQYAHRIAWAIYHGEWPNGLIDHINGDGLDNRIANLRLSTPAQNQANARKRVDNSAGLKGVSYRPGRPLPYIARIRSGGGQVWLGSYETPEAAHAAYVEAAHRVYGEFARSE